jgi:phosphoesterase RecJ-like protein
MARRVFDSNSFGKLKLIGALLDAMELIDHGRLAVLYLDDGMLDACGCTHNDTEGLINLPLTAREIQAVVFFKVSAEGEVRVSMRSKYDVDVRLVANAYGGGGHKNAAGFTVDGPLQQVKPVIIQRLVRAIGDGLQTRPEP